MCLQGISDMFIPDIRVPRVDSEHGNSDIACQNSDIKHCNPEIENHDVKEKDIPTSKYHLGYQR